MALGELGHEKLNAGREAEAAAAFRAQIDICTTNPEPYVSLALLEASRGAKQKALAHMRAAVARGFTDLRRVERAEAWTLMRGAREFLHLQDAIPLLADLERKWPGWEGFVIYAAPKNFDSELNRHRELKARVDAMSPALGARATRLWHRLFDRAAAAMLTAYVGRNPQAPDVDRAVDRLMDLYTGGGLLRWAKMPSAPAGRLGELSSVLHARSPDDASRPVALVAGALAENARRDKKGRLTPDGAQAIRAALQEVVSEFPGSPLAGTALVGLVSTEIEAGRWSRAESVFKSFVESHAGDAAVMARVRSDLGETALRLGGMPAFRATTLDGATVDPASLEGKVVVMDFWATWCPPCVAELPMLRKLAERYGEEIVMLGVNLDETDMTSNDELRRWIADEGMPGRHVQDGLGWDSALVQAFGVREIPFNVVVGPDGSVLAVNEHGKRLEKAVKSAVRSTSTKTALAPAN